MNFGEGTIQAITAPDPFFRAKAFLPMICSASQPLSFSLPPCLPRQTLLIPAGTLSQEARGRSESSSAVPRQSAHQRRQRRERGWRNG